MRDRQSKIPLNVFSVEDNTPAGSTEEFLKYKLRYSTDDSGREIVVVDAGSEEVDVMTGWERPIEIVVEASVRALCPQGIEVSGKGPTC